MDSRHILVVDDEPPIRLLVQKILEVEGYQVTAVASGTAALREVRTWQPDLVVLDLSMPGLDGHATCAMLKRDATRRMPVVILSARSGERDLLQARDAGCDAFLNKPINRAALVAKVAELLTPKPDAPAS
jgi:two-component system response regulator MprA